MTSARTLIQALGALLGTQRTINTLRRTRCRNVALRWQILGGHFTSHMHAYAFCSGGLPVGVVNKDLGRKLVKL